MANGYIEHIGASVTSYCAYVGTFLVPPKRPRFENWVPRRLLEVDLLKPNLRIVSTDSMGTSFTMQKMISIYIHNRCALRTFAFRSSLEKRNLTIVLHPDGELGSVDKSSKQLTWPTVQPSFRLRKTHILPEDAPARRSL